MNLYLKDLIWEECNKFNNFLQIPGIYKHFKEKKEDEDMLYCVNNISMPIPLEQLNEYENSKNSKVYKFHHTELELDIRVIKNNGKYYHSEQIDNNKLVIYTSLYGDRITYLRPLQMFLSKVDINKYPNSKQKFRFELI